MHYLGIVIVLGSTGLHKSAFSTYFFGKARFHLSVFWFFMFLFIWLLAFIFSVICFEFMLPQKT